MGASLERGYQHNFSDRGTSMFDIESRERKAKTMIAVIEDYLEASLENLEALNVGSSAGIIDNYLSQNFKHMTGIDIDESAIFHAQKNYQRDNLVFEIGDAMNIGYDSNHFDVVISSQVYEHVPDAQKMIFEIYRVLKPGGLCYFAAGNRLMWTEPHYKLPLLSVLPRSLAHIYMRLAKKGPYYYEKHSSYWGLKKLVRSFEVIDYTAKIIENPRKFYAEYMIRPGTCKAQLASLLANYAIWLVPGWIWVLKKPSQ